MRNASQTELHACSDNPEKFATFLTLHLERQHGPQTSTSVVTQKDRAISQKMCPFLRVQFHVQSGILSFEPADIPDPKVMDSRDLTEARKRKSLVVYIISLNLT